MPFGADVAELIVALKLDDRGFSGKLNSAARQLKGFDRGLGNITKGAGQVGRGLDKLATRGVLAAAGGLTALVTIAADYEQAWAGVRKTTDGTEKELADLRDEFEQLARSGPTSFQELSAIGEMGGALGIAREDLDEFADVISRLAVSTNLTAEEGAEAFGQLANVLHLSTDDIYSFADSLVALGNDGASTEADIIQLATRFGAAGKQAGLSNEAILALSSTTASMGIEAEAGGGALSRIFQGITTDIGTASDESVALADAMGLSLAELRTAWDHDAGAVFSDLLGHIKELDQFEAAAFLGDLGITNTRDINAITLLAEGSEEYARQLGVAHDATGALNKESGAFFDTTAGKWATFRNQIGLTADSIGGKLLPVANEALEEFGTFLNDPATQRGIEEFGDSLAEGIRGFATEIRNTDFGPLIDTMKGAAAVAKSGFDAFNALPGPVKQLALAAIVGNKVTGGALFDIAGGLGSIAKGAFQIAFARGSSPANPMFVSAVGGLGGPGGLFGGGKGSGLFGGAGKLLGGAFAVTAAAMIADEFHDEIQGFGADVGRQIFPGGAPLEFLGDWQKDLQWPFGPKGAPEWARFGSESPLPSVQPAVLADLERPNLTGATGSSEWARGLAGVEETFKNGTAQWARGLDLIKTEIATLPDTAMVAPGMAALTQNLPTIRQREDMQLAMQYQALAAVRGTTSEVSRLASTPHNVNVDATIPVSVTVNASVIQQQTYRARTSARGAGGRHHSGGFV